MADQPADIEDKTRTFSAELKRRKVYRVAVAYGVVAWLLIQAASILLPEPGFAWHVTLRRVDRPQR